MSKKYEDALFETVMDDLSRSKQLREEAAKKDQEFQALNWHGKQAILFGYLPLDKLKALTVEDFIYLQTKANKNDKIAQFEMARCYIHEVFVAKDEREAVLWYQKSSDLGYVPAKYALASLLQKTDPKSALTLLEEAAVGNYAAAQNTLGICYLHNQYVEPSYINVCTAFEWFKKAQLQGEPRSSENLKKCLKYFREYHIPYPKEINLSLLEEAPVVVPSGYSLAYRHARNLRDATPEDQNAATKTAGLLFKVAEDIFERNSQSKDSKAKSENKLISESILRSAWKLMHEKLNKGVPPSPALENCLFDAARCFIYGFQVQKKISIGVQYCEAATILNFAPAQDFLGTFYQLVIIKSKNSQKIKEYNAKTYSLYSQAASQGFAKAQFNLGVFYQRGACENVPKDKVPAIAFTWFMRAAHLGNEAAQESVANCITNRYGVPLNFCEILPAKTDFIVPLATVTTATTAAAATMTTPHTKTSATNTATASNLGQPSHPKKRKR